MLRVNRFWNLRVKLVALLGCLLAGTLAAQAWLHDASERKLLGAVEEVAGEIATEAVEMMMKATSATAAIPARPRRVSITFRTNPRVAGRNRLLVLDKKPVQMLRELQREMLVRFNSNSTEKLDEALLRSPLDDLVRAMIRTNHPDVPVQQALEFAEEGQKISEYGKTSIAGGGTLLASSAPLNSARLNATSGDSAAAESEPEESAPASSFSADSDLSARKLESPSPQLSKKPTAELTMELPRNEPGSELLREKEAVVESRARAANETHNDKDDLLISGIDLQPHLDRLQRMVREARQRDLVATVGVFLLGVVLAWLLGTRLVRPVTEVVEGMREVASGDLAVRLPAREDPEFGLVSRQFNDMVEQLEDARSMERGLEHHERVQTMGDLAAGVAHDIRNPLSSISLHVGRIRREFVPENSEARERFLDYTGDVKEEIERLNRLVTNFLQLAQPSSHEAESVAPGELLEEVCRLLEKEAAQHQVKFVAEVEDDLCEIRWNRIEAKSAFLNVAMNALQAMDGVGGTLRMTARCDDKWTVISFIDDGPGIPQQDQQRVMLPYVTMRPGGTGLGLAIARRVAERHGGRLELTSEVNVGTEVRFLMPSGNGKAS
ncbi:MAG: HAMP domain-containing protein [Planctomycetes bacterium]|nr:HAMP domain-containing protein [Planctomycetota bacterium]